MDCAEKVQVQGGKEKMTRHNMVVRRGVCDEANAEIGFFSAIYMDSAECSLSHSPN